MTLWAGGGGVFGRGCWWWEGWELGCASGADGVVFYEAFIDLGSCSGGKGRGSIVYG
jgi:hypothetical protein